MALVSGKSPETPFEVVRCSLGSESCGLDGKYLPSLSLTLILSHQLKDIGVSGHTLRAALRPTTATSCSGFREHNSRCTARWEGGGRLWGARRGELGPGGGGGGSGHATRAAPRSGLRRDFVAPLVDNPSDYTVGNIFGHSDILTDNLSDSEFLRSTICQCQEMNLHFLLSRSLGTSKPVRARL
jgi:hypothetical protein